MGLRYVLFGLFSLPLLGEEAWRVKRLVATSYTPLAQQAGLQGLVQLDCELSPDGAVLDCIALSGDKLLQQVARENAKRWIFERVNDSTDSRVRLDYVFRLLGEPVRGPLQKEFWFELPNRVEVTSQIHCVNHAPCNAEEERELQQKPKPRKQGKAAP